MLTLTLPTVPLLAAARCRACGRKRPNRPRGLCWSCYYRPGLRDLYPSTSKYDCRRYEGDPYDRAGPVPLPAAPTRARPGTPEKVAVLEARARARVQLFHPHDYPHDHEEED